MPYLRPEVGHDKAIIAQARTRQSDMPGAWCLPDHAESLAVTRHMSALGAEATFAIHGVAAFVSANTHADTQT